MKLSTLILIGFSFLSVTYSFSQEKAAVSTQEVKASNQQSANATATTQQNENNHSGYPKTYSIGRNGIQQEHNKAYYLFKIKQINILIDAINKKVAYVNADSTRAQQAQSIGWFEQMENSKAKAKQQRLIYKQKIDSLQE